MFSQSVISICLIACFIDSFGLSTSIKNAVTFEDWKSVKEAIVGNQQITDHNVIPITKEMFEKFIKENPSDVFKDLTFDKLKSIYDNEHYRLNSVDDVCECYFTFSPNNLKKFLSRYSENNEIKFHKYKELRQETTLFDQSYEEIAKFISKSDGSTEAFLKVDSLAKHYYLRMPTRLERLLKLYDHDKSGHIDKKEYAEIEKLLNIYKDNYVDLLKDADADKDGKLTIMEAVKYYFTKNPRKLLRLVNEFVRDKSEINQNYFEKINQKYNIFEDNYAKILKEMEPDDKLFVDDLVFYYFKSSRMHMQRAVKSFNKDNDVFDDDKLTKLQAQIVIFEGMTFEEAIIAADFNADKKLTTQDIVAYFFTGSPKLLKTFLKDFDTKKDGSIDDKEYKKMEKEYKLFNKSFVVVKNDINKNNTKLQIEEIVPYYFKTSIKQLIRAVQSFDIDINDDFNENEFTNMENELKLFDGKSFSELVWEIVGNQPLTAADIVTYYFTRDDSRILSAIKSFDTDNKGKLDEKEINEMIQIFKIFSSYNDVNPVEEHKEENEHNFEENTDELANHRNVFIEDGDKKVKIDKLLNRYKELQENPNSKGEEDDKTETSVPPKEVKGKKTVRDITLN